MNREQIEQEKLEILKECQRQMLLKDISVNIVYEIGKVVRNKFDIKFKPKTRKELIEDARRKLT